MILTPIPAERLPDTIRRFAESLTDSARVVFERIADIGAADRAQGDEAMAHHQAAIALARKFGMGILPGSPSLDFCWNGQALRCETEAYVLLHEIAHFQIAPPERRTMIDFGLGTGPETGKAAEAEQAATVFGVEREAEEAMSSLLGILWEVELGQPGLASFLDQNWLEGAGRASAAVHFQKTLASLQQIGLADLAGHPRLKVADYFLKSVL